MTERLENGFPLYMTLATAYPALRETKGAHEYTVRLLELLIKDTPFKLQDISALHQSLKESFSISYSDSTIRRRVYDLRKEGDIILLDGEFDRAQDRVFQWTKTKAPVVPKPLPSRSVFGHEKTGTSQKDPVKHFFARMLSSVFS